MWPEVHMGGPSVTTERDEMTLEKARSVAKAVSHRTDGTSRALAVLEQEVSRLETNADAVSVWMNGIDNILGCEFERAESSHSGKMGFRCMVCLSYSNAPVRGSAAPCKGKVAAARGVSKIA